METCIFFLWLHLFLDIPELTITAGTLASPPHLKAQMLNKVEQLVDLKRYN